MSTSAAEEEARRDDDIWQKHGASQYRPQGLSTHTGSMSVAECAAVLRIILQYLSVTWDRKKCLDLVRNDISLARSITKAQRTRKYTALIDMVTDMQMQNEQEEAYESSVTSFLDAIDPVMRNVAQGLVPFQIFSPEAASSRPDIADHLAQLQLPCLSASKDLPSLLLHGLGSLSEDMRKRVDQIFQERHTYLCNASGSGKTRLLLEGLCTRWGLYLTCLRDRFGIGSNDLALKLFAIKSDPSFVSVISDATNPASALARNSSVVQRHICAVLLSRVLILDKYLSLLPARPWTEEADRLYKKRWLMLQVDPALITGQHGLSSDIFVDLSNIVTEKNPGMNYLGSSLNRLLDKLIYTREEMGKPKSPAVIPSRESFYVVIDEAQSASTDCPDAFRGGDQQKVNWSSPRPLLREVVLHFFQPLQRVKAFIIPTGTNVSQTQLVQAIESTLLKHNSHQAVRPTAGLDRPRAVIEYVRPYLPPAFAESDSGRLLLERIYRWLHGRFRFTTYFVECLIHNLYQSPHRLLNKFIVSSTTYLPSDAESLVASEEPSGKLLDTGFPISSIDFDKLRASDTSTDVLITGTVRDIVFDTLIRASTPIAVGKEHATKLVAIGLARYKDKKGIQSFILEPESTSQGLDGHLTAPTSSYAGRNKKGGSASAGRKKKHLPSSGEHKNDKDASDDLPTIDEPLILLRLASYYNGLRGLRMYKFFGQKIRNVSAKHNGWENYVAICMLRFFAEERPLTDLFTFQRRLSAHGRWVQETRFKGRRGKIVGVVPHSSRSFVGVGSLYEDLGLLCGYNNQRPQPNLGYSSGTVAATRRWAKTGQAGGLLFPDNRMGPDILFLLQLDDAELVWVAVQCKYDTPTAQTFSPATSVKESCIRSTTPDFYYMPNSTDEKVLRPARVHNKVVLDAMKLPGLTKKAGVHGVIRVVTCFPARTILDRDNDPDCGDHPLAELNLDTVASLVGNEEPVDVLEVVKNEVRQNISKPQDDIEDNEDELVDVLGPPKQAATHPASDITGEVASHTAQSPPLTIASTKDGAKSENPEAVQADDDGESELTALSDSDPESDTNSDPEDYVSEDLYGYLWGPPSALRKDQAQLSLPSGKRRIGDTSVTDHAPEDAERRNKKSRATSRR